MKESDILHQVGRFWVAKTGAEEFSIFMDGHDYSITIGEAYPSLDLAIARADYCAEHWDADKQWNRLNLERRLA